MPRPRKWSQASTRLVDTAEPASLTSLLQKGVDAGESHHGETGRTGLDMADAGISSNCFSSQKRQWTRKDEHFGGTPLGWALYGSAGGPCAVAPWPLSARAVRLLVAAGATVSRRGFGLPIRGSAPIPECSPRSVDTDKAQGICPLLGVLRAGSRLMDHSISMTNQCPPHHFVAGGECGGELCFAPLKLSFLDAVPCCFEARCGARPRSPP